MIGNVFAWLQGGEAHGAQAPAAAEAHEPNMGEMIMHHVVDAPEVEVPFLGAVHLPQWEPFHLGPLTIDLSPTKHVVFMLLAATLLCIVMIWTAQRTHGRHARERAPRGIANMIEAFVIFIRDEVALANIGHGGEKYVPFVLTLFFFILVCNLLGLLPWGATATANLSVTATLALITFIVVEVSGMRALGPAGYAKTIFYAPEGMGPVGKALMLVIMTPVELLGKLTKPFALAIRLFANMNAGHFVVLSLIGLTIMGGAALALVVPVLGPVLMAVAIMVLELFVSFLQAFIFAMLTSVFIGLIRHAHH